MMTGQISNPHRLDSVLRSCLGCGASSGDAVLAPECAAFYSDLPGLTIIISPAEKLTLIVPGVAAMRLDQAEMFATRDAIDEGVRDLRAGGRSTVAPL